MSELLVRLKKKTNTLKEAFHRGGVRTDHGFKVLNEFEAIKQDSKHKEGNFAFWRWLISLFLNMQNLETLRSPGCSLEGLMLKLKLQYFGHLMWRVDSLEKTLMLGGIGGSRRRDDRGWDGWMASPTRCARVWVNSRSWWWTGRPGVLRFMESQRVGHDWVTELNRTEGDVSKQMQKLRRISSLK